MSEDDKPDYQVGYGKPPVHSQFKPGQSGNPKGKKKGRKSYKKIAEEVLYAKVKVRTGDSEKKMAGLEALFRKNMSDALNGKPKATEQVLRIARDLGLVDEAHSQFDAADMKVLSEEDHAILARVQANAPGLGSFEEDE